MPVFILAAPHPRPGARFGGALAVYGLYLALAVIVTWPTLRHLSTHLLGHPFGDAYEYVRHIWWINTALRTGQPIFFQPLLGYPDGLAGGWLWSNALQSFPAWLLAFALPLPVAFNLPVLLTLALNGWTAHRLVWHLTALRPAALLAGGIFLAYPTMQGHLSAAHTGLLVLWPTPLLVLALLHLRERGGLRAIAGTALWFTLSILGSNLLLVYLLLPLTGWWLLGRLAAREWAALGRSLLAVALGGALALVFLLPPALEALTTPAYTLEQGSVRYSADLLSIVSPSFQHPLFGRLDYPGRVIGVEPFEKSGYVGLIAGGLALVGVWRRRAARGWLALALLAWVFSLGPLLKIFDAPVRVVVDGHDTHVALPWAALASLPLVNITRTPARFNFTVALAVTIMAGYGAACLLPRLKRPVIRRGLTAALLLGVLFEYQLWWQGLPMVDAAVPAPIAALADRADIRAVLDIPWAHPLVGKEALYLQTAHRHPLIAGHIGRQTPVNPARLNVLERTLDLAVLDAAGVDVVIVHRQLDEADRSEIFARERLGEPIYSDERFAVFEVSSVLSAPVFTAVTPPPGLITDRAEAFVYAPQAGIITLRAALQADDRAVTLTFAGRPVGAWRVTGSLSLDVPLTVNAPGYYTLALALAPPCPAAADPALRCRSLRLTDMALSFAPGASQPQSDG